MSINLAKSELAEAIELYDHLKTELNDQGDLNFFSEEDWQSRIRSLGLDTAKLIQTGRALDDERLIKVLKSKEKKLIRHSEWVKRHKKQLQQSRKQRLKRNERWIKDIEWTVSMAPSAINNAANMKKITQGSNDIETQTESNKLKGRIKELSRIMSKLSQLRDLRRKKLESKGHFFAEDGNQFFNQVKDWHELNQSIQVIKDKDEEYDTMNMEPSKELIVHEEDTWRRMPVDKKAYSYWCESDQSLDALLKNRRMWDQYIIFNKEDNDIIHKVPPTFVAPAPPANWIWASYLS